MAATTFSVARPCLGIPVGPQIGQTLVGQIPNRCCLPGNRKGCAPGNLGQSGCVDINQQFPNCFSTEWRIMPCTSAKCETAGPEDRCALINRLVRHNRCRAVGRKTTIGCPVNQWQCEIDFKHYGLADAPVSAQMVCFIGLSTICQFNYAMCD